MELDKRFKKDNSIVRYTLFELNYSNGSNNGRISNITLIINSQLSGACMRQEDRFILFVDILGYENLVKENSEKLAKAIHTMRNSLENSITTSLLYLTLSDKTSSNIEDFNKELSRSLHIELMSDAIYAYLSFNEKFSKANVFLSLCYASSSCFLEVLKFGFFVRGAITCGKVTIYKNIIIGTIIPETFYGESVIANAPGIIVQNSLMNDKNLINKLGVKILFITKGLFLLNEYVWNSMDEHIKFHFFHEYDLDSFFGYKEELKHIKEREYHRINPFSFRLLFFSIIDTILNKNNLESIIQENILKLLDIEYELIVTLKNTKNNDAKMYSKFATYEHIHNSFRGSIMRLKRDIEDSGKNRKTFEKLLKAIKMDLS